MPQPLTAQECGHAAPAVYYELLAMVQARAFHDRVQKETDPEDADAVLVMSNCALESFLLHYRALREFFSGLRKMKPDNLRAEDYLSAWKTSDVWVTNQSEIDRVHKRLAHLSTARTTLDNQWELAKMEQDVLKTFENFISQLPPDRKAWFQQATELINDRKSRAPVLGLGAESFSTQSGGNPTIKKWPFRVVPAPKPEP